MYFLLIELTMVDPIRPNSMFDIQKLLSILCTGIYISRVISLIFETSFLSSGAAEGSVLKLL